MSTDPAILGALAYITKDAELRYFESVSILRRKSQSKEEAVEFCSCILCLGRQDLFFVEPDLSGLLKESGTVSYTFLEKVVEDTADPSQLVLLLRDRGPRLTQLFVITEDRTRLVDQLTVAWHTDLMCRMGSTSSLQIVQETDVKWSRQQRAQQVNPPLGEKEVKVDRYTLLLKEAFEQDVADPFYVTAKNGEVECSIQVQDPVPLADLEAAGYEHIRWVAMEYLQSVTCGVTGLSIKSSAPFPKRMNPLDDIASWTGWKIAFTSEQHVQVTILLRRECVPPVMDAAQDIVISMKSPHAGRSAEDIEKELLTDVHRAAESLALIQLNGDAKQSLYTSMIQAKLNALLFNEEAMAWMDKLPEKHFRAPALENKARMFLKSLLKILREEHALSSPTLVEAVGSDHEVPFVLNPMNVVSLCEKEIPGLPSAVAAAIFEEKGDGDKSRTGRMPRKKGQAEAQEPQALPTDLVIAANAWKARLARYFAYCVDGGLLKDVKDGFTLRDLVTARIVSAQYRQQVHECLLFLLHIRSKDLTKKWAHISLREMFENQSFFHEHNFNDRVMQTLLELGWLNNLFAGKTESQKVTSMSLDYAKVLAQLLSAPGSSSSLKVSVCRQVLSETGTGPMHPNILVPAVMSAFRDRSVYIKTHATAVLVHLTSRLESVKHTLMDNGAPELLNEHLSYRDEDLLRYTLILLVSLTKAAHHREKISLLDRDKDGQESLAQKLMDLLPGTKEDIKSEAVCAIGQLCSEEEMFKKFVLPESEEEPAPKVAKMLVEFFRNEGLGQKLRTRSVFALKQLCEHGEASDSCRRFASQIIPDLLKALAGAKESRGKELDLEFTGNAVLLLFALSVDKKTLERKDGPDYGDIIAALLTSKLSLADATRDKLQQLASRLEEVQRGQKGADY